MDLMPGWELVGFVVLHAGAISAACGTRVAAGTRWELPIQGLFLAALAAVGIATWCCRQEDLGLGIPSGITLTLMVLMAVVDFRRTHEPSHGHPLSVHR
jgi:hypothetical protein